MSWGATDWRGVWYGVDFAEGGGVTPGRWHSLPGGAPFLLLRVEYGRGGTQAQLRGFCISARDSGPVLTETVRTAGQGRRMEVCSPPETDSRGRPCLDLAREAERVCADRDG